MVFLWIFYESLAWAWVSEPRGIAEVGLNTSARPRSAQMTSMTRARSTGELQEAFPIPINPETGRPVRRDPSGQQVYRVKEDVHRSSLDTVVCGI